MVVSALIGAAGSLIAGNKQRKAAKQSAEELRAAAERSRGDLMAGFDGASGAYRDSFDGAMSSLNEGTQRSTSAINQGAARSAGAINQGLGRQIASIDGGVSQLRSDLSPYESAGRGALNPLMTEMGIGPGGYNPNRPDYNLDYSIGGLSEGFQSSPGYQYQMDEMMRGVQNSAAARGMAMSGATLKELQRNAGGLANQDYWNYFGASRQSQLDRRMGMMDNENSEQRRIGNLQWLSSMGQNAAGAMGNASMQGSLAKSGAYGTAAGNLANVYTGQGGNLANIYSNAGSNAANLYNNYGQNMGNAYMGTATNLANVNMQGAGGAADMRMDGAAAGASGIQGAANAFNQGIQNQWTRNAARAV